MFYVYVLKSLRNNKRYTGFSGQDPSVRLVEHNCGKNSYPRRNRPFVLLHSEEFVSEDQARRRERFLKTGQGRRFLDRLFPLSSAGRASGCQRQLPRETAAETAG